MSWDVDDVEVHADVLADGLPEPIIDRDPGDETSPCSTLGTLDLEVDWRWPNVVYLDGEEVPL